MVGGNGSGSRSSMSGNGPLLCIFGCGVVRVCVCLITGADALAYRYIVCWLVVFIESNPAPFRLIIVTINNRAPSTSDLPSRFSLPLSHLSRILHTRKSDIIHNM